MDEECVICINSQAAPRVTLLCGHAFHTKCVEPWLLQKGSCPLCRADHAITAVMYANPELTDEMRDFKPVTRFTTKDAITLSGWVIYTKDEMARLHQWMLDRHMALVQDEIFPMACQHVWIMERNVLDGILSDLRQNPQQPPHGDFYVE